jgi:hypothetical protein
MPASRQCELGPEAPPDTIHTHQVALERVTDPQLDHAVALLHQGLDLPGQFIHGLKAQTDPTGIGWHPSLLPAEQAPDRLTEFLTLDIPQRQIHA